MDGKRSSLVCLGSTVNLAALSALAGHRTLAHELNPFARNRR